jgi:hypothetical protein
MTTEETPDTSDTDDAEVKRHGFLDESDDYDHYLENKCPECGSDVGVISPAWWCDTGHMGVVDGDTLEVSGHADW